MTTEPWTFRVRCPHGVELIAPFDELKYAKEPVTCPDGPLHQEAPPAEMPGRFALWRMERRFRKQLKSIHERLD